MKHQCIHAGSKMFPINDSLLCPITQCHEDTHIECSSLVVVVVVVVVVGKGAAMAAAEIIVSDKKGIS
jgi:hypothetical protein